MIKDEAPDVPGVRETFGVEPGASAWPYGDDLRLGLRF